MTRLRAELLAVVDTLVAASAGGRAVTLDDVGEALGAKAASVEEIDAVLSELQARAVHVGAGGARDLEQELGQVVSAARSLRQELGRRPRVDELAARTGLSVIEVQAALRFARILQR